MKIGIISDDKIVMQGEEKEIQRDYVGCSRQIKSKATKQQKKKK